MTLYLGRSGKLDIILDGTVYCLNLSPTISIVNNARLISYDNYILMDCNGIYLVPSNHIDIITSLQLLSLDDYILKDSNGLQLSSKED